MVVAMSTILTRTRSLQVALLTTALLFGAGCKKEPTVAEQPARTDQQISNDVQANISAESGKRQKDAEIAVRRLSFRLNEIAKDVDLDERPAIKEAIGRLDKAHDDLLAHMFKK